MHLKSAGVKRSVTTLTHSLKKNKIKIKNTLKAPSHMDIMKQWSSGGNVVGWWKSVALPKMVA